MKKKINNTPTHEFKNKLFYGDNLTIMKEMPSNSIDLIYLDPPFNSKKTYNLMYKNITGEVVPEQVEAFCDSWEMDEEKQELMDNMQVTMRNYEIDADFIFFWDNWVKSLRKLNPKLLAYLLYMTTRLLEMRRILKPTGSIYYHCDPTASHYVKIIMDGIFNHENFRNEIVWGYRTGGVSIEYVRGFCTQKKTRDSGIDGRLYFKDKNNKLQSMIISVKGGKLKASDIRDLIGTVEKEKAFFGGLISFDEPSKDMIQAGIKMGRFEDMAGNKYNRIQFITIKEMLEDKKLFNIPQNFNRKDFKKDKQERFYFDKSV